MLASKLLWNNVSLEGVKNGSTNEILEKASIIHYNFKDRKIYSYLHIGQIVVNKIEDIIRKKLGNYDFQEIYLTPLQPHSIWESSGRSEKFNKRMLFLKTSTDKDRYVLSPTNEEVSTLLAQKLISSYKQLPSVFFQLTDKFRDDPEAKHGIVRTNVFRILESYSFDLDKTGMDETAGKFEEAFDEIFKQLDLDIKKLEKRKNYLTFIAKSEEEGDTKLVDCKCGTHVYSPSENNSCENCKIEFKISKGIELGCVIKEGPEYSKKLGAYVLDREHNRIPISIGTYGLGISRIIYSIVDRHRDFKGINWPPVVTPIVASIIPIDIDDKEQFNYAKSLYDNLKSRGSNIIFEDRDKTLGEKLRLYDLIGTTLKFIIGKQEIGSRTLTVQYRDGRQDTISLENLDNILK